MMKPSILLSAILVLALALRLGMGIFLGFDSPPDQAACGADTIEFEHMAWSVAQGEGFTLYPGGPPTAFRAPGYPMLLAALYALFGRVFWINRVVLSLLGTATCGLVYLLAVRVQLDRRAALFAAFLTAVLPLQFYWCGHFMSEPLSAFLNVATCLLLVSAMRPDRSPTPQHSNTPTLQYSTPLLFAAGLICGLAALTRAASVLVPVMLGGLWLLSRRVDIPRAALRATVFAAAMALVIAPWTIRNVVVLDRFALISTNGGSTFWGANNDIVTEPGEHWGRWVSTTRVAPERKKAEVWSLDNEVDRDRKEWAIGREWVGENVEKLPTLLAGKFWRLVKPFPDSANRIYALAVAGGWIVLFPLAAIGLGLVPRDREARARFIPIHAQLLTLLATVAIFYGSERFRAPYEPLLAVYAAAGASAAIRRSAKRQIA